MGSLVPGWDSPGIPGKPPPGFEDYQEPRYFSPSRPSMARRASTGSNPLYTSLGRTSAPAYKYGGDLNPQQVGPLREAQYAVHAAGAGAGAAAAALHPLSDYDSYGRDKAEAGYGRAALGRHSMLARVGGGAGAGTSKQYVHGGAGAVRGAHGGDHATLSPGRSDDGSQASDHSAAHVQGWWARLDSGRMNDAHIAEIEAEEEGPLSRRSHETQHIPYCVLSSSPSHRMHSTAIGMADSGSRMAQAIPEEQASCSGSPMGDGGMKGVDAGPVGSAGGGRGGADGAVRATPQHNWVSAASVAS